MKRSLLLTAIVALVIVAGAVLRSTRSAGRSEHPHEWIWAASDNHARRGPSPALAHRSGRDRTSIGWRTALSRFIC